MNVAISGKGGSGTTTVSGTLARSLADEGYGVIAIDGDGNSDLQITLGVARDRVHPPLPADLLQRVESSDGDTTLELAKTAQEVIDDYATTAPDGVTLLNMSTVGHASIGCTCSAHVTARKVVADFVRERDEATVMDMVAGVQHLDRGTAQDVDVLLVVVEPYYKSMETGRRTTELAADLGIPEIRVVANKVRDDHDRDAIRAFCDDHGLEIVAVVPFDDAVRRADQEGIAPIDYDGESGAVRAVRDLADGLEATHGRDRTRPEATD